MGSLNNVFIQSNFELLTKIIRDIYSTSTVQILGMVEEYIKI